jgi:hypothetical protein
MHGFGTVEAAARFCCAAGRIAQLPSSMPHHGQSGLSSKTTAGFSPPFRCSAERNASSFVGQQVMRVHSSCLRCFSVVSVLTEPALGCSPRSGYSPQALRAVEVVILTHLLHSEGVLWVRRSRAHRRRLSPAPRIGRCARPSGSIFPQESGS